MCSCTSSINKLFYLFHSKIPSSSNPNLFPTCFNFNIFPLDLGLNFWSKWEREKQKLFPKWLLNWDMEATGASSYLYQTEGISLWSKYFISHQCLQYCYSENSSFFRFYIKKKNVSKSPVLFQYRMKTNFQISHFFFPLNLNSHFSTSSAITWSILYFTANLTHVINRVSSYKMNYLYEGSKSQNVASFLHEYFCASRLSHTSSHIWLLSDWEQRPQVAAPIEASALPLFFPGPRGGKNMTLLYWECFITPSVSALSLCLQSSREDGKISSFLMALLVGRVSSGTLATSAWTLCYGLYRSYVARE